MQKLHRRAVMATMQSTANLSNSFSSMHYASENCSHQMQIIFCVKCSKFDVGRGSAPDPAGGAHTTHSDLLAGFKGAASRQGS